MLKLDQEQILNKINEKLSNIGGIIAVILFGSTAREEHSIKSDIDLFIIVESRKIKSKIEDVISSLNFATRIQPVIRKIDELKKMDIGLLQNIFKEGKLVFVKKPINLPVNLIIKQSPYVIFRFDLKNLEQKEKVRLNTALYGTKKKKYGYKGLLEMNNGIKLGDGAIMIPFKLKREFLSLFDKYKVKYECLDVWKNR